MRPFRAIICWVGKVLEAERAVVPDDNRLEDESFAAAREERLRVSGNPKQYNDLSPFLREQELFRRLVRESSLPSVEIDVSGGIPAAADRIAGWLEETGGLYLA